MKVYVEYVLIDNFIIDFALLYAVLTILGKNVNKLRICISSIFGSVFALILPLFENYPELKVVYRIATGLFIVLIAHKHYTFRSFYITALTFFALTFLTGGAIIGIYNILGVDYNSEVCVATVFIPVCFLVRFFIKLIKYFYRKKTDIKYTYAVELTVFNKTLKAQGFLDTGNTLYDNGTPVILCDKAFAKKLIGNDIIKVNLRKITLTTANGKSKNFAFNLENLKIYIGKQPNIYNNVTVCIADSAVFDGYEIILHPKLMEGEDYASAMYVEKVS